MKSLKVKGKSYSLPIYLPDATRGVTKGVDSEDLVGSGVRGVVANTYHLMSTPGTKILNDFGGVKNFMNFDGLVVSDSGGWQVFSLIHRNGGVGEITNSGVVFNVKGEKKELFTPRRSIQVQFDINSDTMICLDDFTSPSASKKEAEVTVERTVRWAKASKLEFEKQVKMRKIPKEKRPLLFAVVQGHNFKDLRKRCAEELIEIGFDGYGFGGYPVDDKGNLDLEISAYVAKLIPDDKYKFALGIGKIDDIVNLSQMGWDIFDCTLPTRDARHKRLVVLGKKPGNIKDFASKDSYSYIYIDRGKYKDDNSSVSDVCDCVLCKNYSKAYLNHLFKIKDTLAFRLATIHNLRTYTTVMESLRRQ